MLSVDKLKPGGSFELAVVGTVKSGYHIGAHDSDLYPAKLTMVAPKGITFGKPVYPKGVRVAFPFAPNDKVPVYEGKFVIRLKGQVAKSLKPGKVTITSKLDTQACKGEQCYQPQVSEAKLGVSVAKPGEAIKPANKDIFKSVAASTGAGGTGANGLVDRLVNSGPLVLFPGLFLFGLIIAFTPCVYPMIPVTMGYFGSQDRSHTGRVKMLAAVYVLGLAITYSTLGVVAALTGGVFGGAMQKPVVIAAISLVLVALALSMFGLYELRPPAFIASRSSGKSGVLGALVMGLIFGVAIAPCAGPIVLGLMLIVAKMGKPVLGFLMFFTLSLGLGTPIFALAVFSAKMPMPGMWMMAVKKIAGFVLLGAAVHFASPLAPEPISRYLLPAVIIAAGIYLGFFEESIASIKFGSSFGKVGGMAAVAIAGLMLAPQAPKPSIQWETYSPQKISQAVEAGKPVMIDFTASWCGVCKELEHGPFSDPSVIRAANRFSRFRMDGSDASKASKAAEKKYAVKGYPTVIFIDRSGKQVKSARVGEYVDSAEMIKRMEQVE